jgi:hypothetical protein
LRAKSIRAGIFRADLVKFGQITTAINHLISGYLSNPAMEKIFYILFVLTLSTHLCVAQEEEESSLMLADTIKVGPVHDSIFKDISILAPRIIDTLKQPDGFTFYSKIVGYGVALKKKDGYHVIVMEVDTVELIDLRRKKDGVLVTMISPMGYSSMSGEGGWHEDNGYVRIYDLDSLEMWGDLNNYFSHEGWSRDQPVERDETTDSVVTDTDITYTYSTDASCTNYEPAPKQRELDFVHVESCYFDTGKVTNPIPNLDTVRYKLGKAGFIRLKKFNLDEVKAVFRPGTRFARVLNSTATIQESMALLPDTSAVKFTEEYGNKVFQKLRDKGSYYFRGDDILDYWELDKHNVLTEHLVPYRDNGKAKDPKWNRTIKWHYTVVSDGFNSFVVLKSKEEPKRYLVSTLRTSITLVEMR